MKFFITGGCGFLGSNLAAHLMQTETVWTFDDLSRKGSRLNLEWLRRSGDVQHLLGDVRDAVQVSEAVRTVAPDVIFHLAGQVAMTKSLLDPRFDFETNVLGSLNLLEAVRAYAPEAIVVYASTNKVYGDLEELDLVEDATRYRQTIETRGIDERTPLDFQSPYGCSKGAADQYMLEYARAYGLKTVVFRHSSIYGGRQFATKDQGWVAWFCRQALESRAAANRPPFTLSGNGKQVRDLLHVTDAVHCYLAAVQRIELARGQAFNIGGGMQNSMSLLELLAHLEKQLDVGLTYRHVAERESDQRFFVADSSKAARLLGWAPSIQNDEGIASILRWESDRGAALVS